MITSIEVIDNKGLKYSGITNPAELQKILVHMYQNGRELASITVHDGHEGTFIMRDELEG